MFRGPGRYSEERARGSDGACFYSYVPPIRSPLSHHNKPSIIAIFQSARTAKAILGLSIFIPESTHFAKCLS